MCFKINTVKGKKINMLRALKLRVKYKALKIKKKVCFRVTIVTQHENYQFDFKLKTIKLY